MPINLLKEIIPLTPNDCFTVFKRIKSDFDFPLHFHEEYELNFIHRAKGAKRVVGDHMAEIDDWELVLIGPNLPHGWFNNKVKNKNFEEITIQFQKDLFDEKFLNRNQMSFIRGLLERSRDGVLFSTSTIKSIEHRIQELTTKTGFDSVLELMSILHDLSISRNAKSLSDKSFSVLPDPKSHNSRRIEMALNYMNANFESPIGLADVAKVANMTEVAFSRFFKQRTGSNFIDNLTNIRLGHASRMLIETTQSISEVAYQCGFNNISNFNRIFKKKKKTTPKEFREEYMGSGKRTFV